MDITPYEQIIQTIRDKERNIESMKDAIRCLAGDAIETESYYCYDEIDFALDVLQKQDAEETRLQFREILQEKLGLVIAQEQRDLQRLYQQIEGWKI